MQNPAPARTLGLGNDTVETMDGNQAEGASVRCFPIQLNGEVNVFVVLFVQICIFSVSFLSQCFGMSTDD